MVSGCIDLSNEGAAVRKGPLAIEVHFHNMPALMRSGCMAGFSGDRPGKIISYGKTT